MEIENLEQVRRAIGGDREAYGRLVESYQGMAFAVALNVTGNYNDSLDVIQEAFVKAYRKLFQLSDPSRFGSWLYTITRRAAFRLLEERRKLPVAAGEDLLEAIVSDRETPAEAYAREELSRILWTEVGALPPRTREAILLHYMEGFSIAHAGEFLGISEAAMKVRLAYGREKLKESMPENVEREIEKHRPDRKTWSAIIAALPPAGPSPVGVSPPEGAAGALHLLFAVKGLKIGGAVLAAGIAAILLLMMLRPPPVPGPVPPAFIRHDERGAGPQKSPAEEPLGPPAESAPARDEGATHAIAGRVLERLGGRPVAGVIGCVYRESRLLEKRATGEGGDFRLTGLRPGRYEVLVDIEAGGLEDLYFLPEDRLRTSIDLKEGDVEDLVFLLSPASSIRGVVQDPGGKAVAGAKLTLDHYRFKPRRSTAESDAEGRFSFTGLFPSRGYEISCEAPGFNRAEEKALATSIEEPLENLVILLFPGEGATIRGRVVDAAHEPVEGVPIKLLTGTRSQHRTTDSGGLFEFGKVQAGHAIAILERYGKDMDVTVGPNEVLDLEFVLDERKKPGSIAGTLVDAEGQPIAGGTLHAQPAGTGADTSVELHRRYSPQDDVSMAIPDAQGRFRLGDLKPGMPVDILYRGASGPREATDALGVQVPSEGIVVTFRSTEEKPRRIAVRGTVRDASTGKPIQRFAALIQFSMNFPDKPPRCWWDREGRFEIRDVSYNPNRTFVYAEAEGYAGKAEPVGVGESETAAEIEVLLSRGGGIAGRVIDASGAAVPGAKVYLWGEEERFVISDAEGAFSLKNARERARRQICATHPAFAPFLGVPFELAAGMEIEGYEIRLSRGGTIAGCVRDARGAPIAHARISLLLWGERLTAFRADGAGEFSLDHVPPGECQLQVEHRGFVRLASVTVEEGGTVRVDLQAEGREKEERKEASQGKISGRVLLPDRAPAGSVPVRISRRPSPAGDRVAAAATNFLGEFSFGSLPPGAYEIRAGSETLGEAVVEADLAAGRSAEGLEIVLPETGRILVSAVDASSGAPLRLSGMLVLMDSGERWFLRSLRGTEHKGETGPTAVTAGRGTYLVAGVLEDGAEKEYVAPFQPVTVAPGIDSPIRLAVYPQVKVKAAVTDLAGKPARDFLAEAYGDGGLRFPLVPGEGGRFEVFAIRGALRLIVKRGSKTVHDGVIDVNPPPPDTQQEARIAIE